MDKGFFVKAKRGKQLKKSQVNIWDRHSLNNRQASNLNQIKKIWSEILNKEENKKFIEACDYLEANKPIKDESLLPLFFSHLHEDLKFCYMMDRFERDVIYKKRLKDIKKILQICPSEKGNLCDDFFSKITTLSKSEKSLIEDSPYKKEKSNPEFKFAKYDIATAIHAHLMQNKDVTCDEFNKKLDMTCQITAQLIRGLNCKDSSKYGNGARIKRDFKGFIKAEPGYFHSYCELYSKYL